MSKGEATINFTASQAIEVYTKGTKAWFPDKEEGWISASCISNKTEGDKVIIIFEDDNNGKEHVFESTIDHITKTNGSTLPPLRNPPKIEYTDDLTNLSYLNEPSVLNSIRTRYMQHLIYTYSGIVLIAVNPFDRVSLYEPDIIQQYSGKKRGELEPHLFAIAEDAYRCMIREKRNQTIVVSGESGAGKTVSAKYIMRYFATADDQETTNKKKRKAEGMMTEVEEQILATNPIMEAFGNAKTTRNDNSSRFGKYIEIQFDKDTNIVGAKIKTYLLERSRLIFQPETERNYHIFYQLCAGAPSKERQNFEIGNSYSDFHYLNQSGTGEIPGVDDAEEFEITQKALSTVGLSVDLQWRIFRVLAALLHIGNIKITGRGDAIVSDTDHALLIATRLLGIKLDEFRKWIVRKQIITRSEKIITNLNPTQAHVVKDSVAKYIYSNLFDWLVGIINESLSCPNPDNISNFIGVLDIYGFEHFKKNSFEQFCINYANEKLQQQFNQHVFKLEQEEYMREKINWTFIEFSDNQKCIEIIEGKLGILSLLDEESRLPAGTDQGFCQKLYDNFNNPEYKNYFKKPRFSNEAFTIAHYAHDVQYETENFLEKNKDSVPDEHLQLLQNAEFPFLQEILAKSTEAANAAIISKENKRKSLISRKPTLGSIFKHSLISLMDTIESTNVHYIRCIKPNEAKVAWDFEAPMVLSQLRACGVLETIRISCLGYPSRWTYEEFAERYYALVSSHYWDPKENPEVKSLCQIILDTCIQDTDKYQMGETKIFFRAGQLAYLEKLRSDKFNVCATILQKNIRRFVYRHRYLRIRELAIRLQCLTRKRIAQKELVRRQQEKAATIIQTYFRRYRVRKEYLAKKGFILKLQTAIRARMARQDCQKLRENNAAIQIQRHVRGMIARKWYKTQLQYVTFLQSCIRRRAAYKQLLALKVEAKSANHFKEISYKLENRVVELTQTVDTLKAEKKEMHSKLSHLETQLQYWTDRHEKMEKDSKAMEQSLRQNTVPSSEFETLKKEKETLASEHAIALEKVTQLTTELDQLREELNKEKEKNKTIVVELNKKKKEEENEEAIKARNDEVADLKAQIVALKSQLAKSMHTRQQSSLLPPTKHISNASHRTISPSNHTGNRRHMSRFTDEHPLVETIPQENGYKTIRQNSVLINRKLRRNSSAEVTGNVPKTSIEQIRKIEELGKMKSPRPTSVGQSNTLAGGKSSILDIISDNPEEEINAILRQEESLREEVLEGLIQSLKLPLPNEKNPPSRKEVMFPAHIISLCVNDMWRIGYNRESETFLFAVIETIQKRCLTYVGDESIVPCAFWLTNVHELLSLIVQSENRIEIEMKRREYSIGWKEFEKLIQTIKFELQCLEDTIFHVWMKEIKRKYNKIIIPALIESQSLPGFITNDTGRFLNKLLLGATGPAYSMDDLLNFLNKLHRIMICYYIEPSVINQVLIEILKMTGVIAFNDLLMRKNFSSWKRAMQIQYNITRVEEWCKSHGIPEGTLQLEHLMQATKLLQFKKATLEDIENIYDVCWILSPTQVQKLISQYHVADYENPIRPEILRAVASRVVSGDKSDILLLDSVSIEDTSSPYEIPEPRESQLYLYLPAWLHLKRIRRLTLLESILIEQADNHDTKTVEQEKISMLTEEPSELTSIA
ncbi:P-loop containing nucleoside triphosphate hydrolase protein [Cokeromyces recurvatus]|uniref:P-loop containing nucleoside triphosphate hydrolase protein n=1 Tax=Cokeromyces recurvatus TaxID=90255 RepID=UPI00221EE73C|nr:P-loop containing nucleoside triphosphate hydrolase protein [Cokeromyces recurvatus]KAI7905951.1 P-loop containing nucleoside triphosphate hydrolase protein [Cokeromyces recurvatus]